MQCHLKSPKQLPLLLMVVTSNYLLPTAALVLFFCPIYVSFSYYSPIERHIHFCFHNNHVQVDQILYIAIAIDHKYMLHPLRMRSYAVHLQLLLPTSLKFHMTLPIFTISKSRLIVAMLHIINLMCLHNLHFFLLKFFF